MIPRPGRRRRSGRLPAAVPHWGYDFVLSPPDFAAQYDLGPLYTAGTNGSGQTIAVVNDSNININFVNNFRTLFGLPANPPQVIIDGNDPGIDGVNNPGGPNGDSVEAYLDVEWAGSGCSQCNHRSGDRREHRSGERADPGRTARNL